MNNKYYLQLEEEITVGQTGDFDDEDIVKKSLSNPRLFEMFVDKYQAVFLRTAGRVLKKREDAEDSVQEAFVKIYKNAHKFEKRPGIEFKSWAFKILMNNVFTKYRKIKKTFGDVEYLDEVLSEDAKMDDAFEKRQKKDEVESALRLMPAEMSELMKEHYLNDKPYAEIASARGISISALKMKLFRARKKFKEVMGKRY